MSGLNLTDEEKADLIRRISDLCGRNVLNKADYAAILGICQVACKRRIEEIEKVIGKTCDIMQ